MKSKNNYIAELLKKYFKNIRKMEKFVYGKNVKSRVRRQIIILSAVGFILSAAAAFTGNSLPVCFILLSVWFAGSFVSPYMLLKKKVSDKKRKIEIELPEFMDKMSLMMQSGMQLRKALSTVADSSEGAFSEEIRDIIRENERMGNVEENSFSAIEMMASECEISGVNTFAALISQNAKKGSDTLCEMLEIQADIMRNERKNTIKRIGEETATYMLIPSIIIFTAIMVMMIAPAIMMLK